MVTEDAAAEMTAGTSTAAKESPPSTSRNKIKLLCSHGGKILPKPNDGSLRYVGGETRVIAVPRDVNFSELMKKLATVAEGNIVLKYQLISDDLDALISVMSDEDLRHMLEEYDRYDLSANSKFRVFLFPSSPIILEHHSSIDPRTLEQRYIDAVNGLVLTLRHPSPNGDRPASSIGINSSAGSSPKSPESTNLASPPLEPAAPRRRGLIPRVRSSPTISSLTSYHHQEHQQPQQSSTTLLHHQYKRQHGFGGLQSQERLTPLQSLERLVSMRSGGSWKYQEVQTSSRLPRHSSLRGRSPTFYQG